jgi:hypothetical protein
MQPKSLHSETLKNGSISGKLSAQSSALKHNSVGFARRWLCACNLQHNLDTQQMSAANGPISGQVRTEQYTRSNTVCCLRTVSISQSTIFSVIHLLSHGQGVSIAVH